MRRHVVTPEMNHRLKATFAASLSASAIVVLLAGNTAGAETTFPRDGQGRITGWTETQGRRAAFELTADGKVARVTASGGLEASHTFDDSGRVISIQHPNGGRETLTYDAQGRISSANDRLGRRHLFTHDASGHVLSHTDPAGRVIRFARKPDQGAYGYKAGNASPVIYRYDANRRLVAATDGTNSVRRLFDSAGKLVRVEYPTLTKSVQYTYDDNGRRTSVVDPDGGRTRYEYSGAKLAAIVAPDGGRFEYTRDDKGRVTSLRYPNGITGRWTYNDRGQVTAINYEAGDRSVVAGDRSVVAGAAYSYDNRGNLLARRDAGGAVSAFQYDEAGQLISEISPGGATSYRYGPGGNRVAVERNGDVAAYKHDAADQILQSGPVQYIHDARGRLAERRTASGNQKFEFDAAGRLQRVTASDGAAVSYEYLPTGQRISRSDGRRKTYFVYDRLAILQELGDDLNPVAIYVHAPGLDRPLAMMRAGETYYYHADRNGSIIALSDQRGQVVARYSYDAFGAPLTQVAAPKNPFLFNAREWEPALGLYYYRARYYDPVIGRFLSIDPLAGRITDPLELNPYLFASNNPLRFKDPLGLSNQENGIYEADGEYSVELDRLEYEQELLYEHEFTSWRLRTRNPRYVKPEDINTLRRSLAELEAEMAEAGLAPPRLPNNDGPTINPRPAEPAGGPPAAAKPGPSAATPAPSEPGSTSLGPRVGTAEPAPIGPMPAPKVYGPDTASIDNSIDVELFAPDSIDVAAADAAASAPPPGTIRGPNAARPGNTLRAPPPGARPPAETVPARPAEPSVSDSIDWQLRQPDSVDVAAAEAAEAAAAAQQPGTMRGPNAARPGNTLRTPARPPVETLPAGPSGAGTAAAAPPAGPGPRTAAAPPSGGAAPAGSDIAAPSAPGRFPRCTPEVRAKMGREGAKAGAVAAALGFYTCAYAKSFGTGSALKLSKQDVQDCLAQAGIAAVDGFQIAAFAVVVPKAIPLLAAHGLYEGSKSIKEMQDEWEKDKQSAIDEQAAIDCGSDNVTQNAMNTSWAACDFRNALRLAQLLRSRPSEPSWLATIMPNIEKGARAQAAVEPILAKAATTSDPAQKNALLEQAKAAAEGVPCLVDRIGKPAAVPPAGAACVPDTALTDVFELCGPEFSTGRLVCYGVSRRCKNGDAIIVGLSYDEQCRNKGGIWKVISEQMVCGDISKTETCSPATCREPRTNERAWTCTPVQSCSPPQKVAGLQSAVTTDPNVFILDSPDNPKPPDDPQVFVLDSPDTPPRGPQGGAVTPAPPPSSATNRGSSPPTPRVNIFDPPMPELPQGPPRINIYEPPPPHSQPPGTPRVNIYDPPPPHSQPPKAGVNDPRPPTPPPAVAGSGTKNSGSCDTKNGVTTCVDIAGNKCTSRSGFCDPTPKTPGAQPATAATPPKAATPPASTPPKTATPSQPLPPTAVAPAPNAPPATPAGTPPTKNAGAPMQPLPPLPPAQLTPPGKTPDTKTAALPPQPLPPTSVGPTGDAASNAAPGKSAALPPAVLPPAAVGPAARPPQPLPPSAVGPAPQPSQPAPPPPGRTAELPPPALPNGNAGGDTSAPDLKCSRTSQRIKAHDGANVNWDMDVPVNGHCRGVWRPGQNTHSLSIAMASHPGQGSATISGTTITYQARPGYRGKDRFVLTIRWSNSTGNHQGTATYHVTVQ